MATTYDPAVHVAHLACGCGWDAPGGRIDRDPDEVYEELRASVAHETALLGQVSSAHSAGYTNAAAQARGLLDAAFADAPSRELAGLAHAARILERLRPATHRLTLRIAGSSVVARISCDAGDGADCRMTCEGGAEGRCDGVCVCDGDLVDGGMCLASAWLNDYTLPDLLDAYVGPEDRELTSAPVVARWAPRADAWQWMYAVDLPDGQAEEDWTRA
jgi:hypothetical protein